MVLICFYVYGSKVNLFLCVEQIKQMKKCVLQIPQDCTCEKICCANSA